MKHFKSQEILNKRFLAALMTFMLTSCGANPLQSYETKDPGEDATLALEDKDPDKAISILNAALEKDPQNWTYVSILALAYAERAGIDALTLAQNMAKSSTTKSSENGVTSLFSIMPDATDAHISDIDQALSLEVSIPAASRTTADILKLAMFETAALTLRTKKYDTNGDGVISAAEALAMSTKDAAAIVSQLIAAAAAFSGGTISSETSQAAAAQVTNIQTKIDACPGSDSESRLKNYLSKSGC